MMTMFMENVTLIVEKRGGTPMQVHVPMLLLTSRTMRNISLNGTNGRRSRKDVAQKHRGVVKFGTHCQVGFRDSPWLRQANRQ